MAGYTQQEALAFIDSMRRALEGKVGFRWLTEKMAGLRAYVEALGEENARLREFIERRGLGDAYEEERGDLKAADDESRDA